MFVGRDKRSRASRRPKSEGPKIGSRVYHNLFEYQSLYPSLSLDFLRLSFSILWPSRILLIHACPIFEQSSFRFKTFLTHTCAMQLFFTRDITIPGLLNNGKNNEFDFSDIWSASGGVLPPVGSYSSCGWFGTACSWSNNH